eukprot:9167241-Pyramimonas_sp.AAC.1
MEVFSPPRIAPRAQSRGGAQGAKSSWDLKTGWDSRRANDQLDLWAAIEKERPGMIWLRPPCRLFSAISRISRA